MNKDKNFNTLKTLEIGTKLLDLSTPKVMGILNLTKDSFYDGGRFNSEKKALNHVQQMIYDGAEIIDIGAHSSRPNAPLVEFKNEWKRLGSNLKNIRKEFPQVLISIDTFRSEIAKRSFELGADIINDISSGELDKEMFTTVANLNAPYIMMHMQGNPQDMQKNPKYQNISSEITTFFEKKIKCANQLGIKTIIVDPGFGFGKQLEHNYQLLNELDKLSKFNLPVMVGISRKSMIYKPLECNADDALNGTTFIHAFCLIKGASILRVHDVKEASECIKLFNFAKINC
ncbi:MAG: dihydropteroate synthase [Bacteroidota bacterium]|nr:dihydropteroate synthase [Bacteroidota bacterium]MEE3038125.1 dihydropteroate synthase [Bacteroidota bacterium]